MGVIEYEHFEKGSFWNFKIKTKVSSSPFAHFVKYLISVSLIMLILVIKIKHPDHKHCVTGSWYWCQHHSLIDIQFRSKPETKSFAVSICIEKEIVMCALKRQPNRYRQHTMSTCSLILLIVIYFFITNSKHTSLHWRLRNCIYSLNFLY